MRPPPPPPRPPVVAATVLPDAVFPDAVFPDAVFPDAVLLDAVLLDAVLHDASQEHQLVNAIYNPNNVEITDQDIVGILSYFGITMQPYNLNLYRRAFVHDSYSYTHYPELVNTYPNIQSSVPKLYSKHNQRLELLGDGVVELVAKYYIYVRWPGKDEGFITDTKIEMVKNETIGKLAMDLGLQRWYMMSRVEEQKGLRSNVAKLGCLFEAFVGAIFLDFNRMDVTEQGWTEQPFLCGPGFQVAQLFTTRVFDAFMNWTAVLISSENYKRPLQELLQCEYKVAPIFDFGPNRATDGFNMCVFLYIPPKSPSFKKHGAIQSLYHQSTPVSAFKSFMEIHNYLARNRNVCILLGEGYNRKKQMAEQFACKSAIEAIKCFSDFENVANKTKQKYVALTAV